METARLELQGEAGEEEEAASASASVSVEKELTLTRVDFDEGGAAAVFAPVQEDAEPVVMG